VPNIREKDKNIACINSAGTNRRVPAPEEGEWSIEMLKTDILRFVRKWHKTEVTLCNKRN
jgi:hypothetical protein